MNIASEVVIRTVLIGIGATAVMDVWAVIAYAALLIGICGLEWARTPTLMPAVLVGVSMLVAPFFIMQPCMGAGLMGSKTPKPNSSRLRSLMNHVVFGIGLYVAASVVVILLFPPLSLSS